MVDNLTVTIENSDWKKMRDNARENEYFHEEWDSLWYTTILSPRVSMDYMKMDGILIS